MKPDETMEEILREMVYIYALKSYYPYKNQEVSFCKNPDSEENFYRAIVKEILRQGSEGVLSIVTLTVYGQWIWTGVYDGKAEPYEVTALMHRDGVYYLKG